MDSEGPIVSGSLVKGKVGQNITVPCFYPVKSIQDITSMCWGRDSCPASKCYRTIIWTDGWKVTEQYNSRYMLKGDLPMGDVSLTIVNAEEADSGIYCCRVEISGWFNDRTSNHKVVIEKARISTASPHTYTSEQTSAPRSTSESSFTIIRTWPSVSTSEAPQTASGPCSSTSGFSDVTTNLQNASLSLSSQQYSENGLYIGIGLCAVLLAILILALFLTRRKYFSQGCSGASEHCCGRCHMSSAVGKRAKVSGWPHSMPCTVVTCSALPLSLWGAGWRGANVGSSFYVLDSLAPVGPGSGEEMCDTSPPLLPHSLPPTRSSTVML
uniref:Ig-like domain-containing protein n=1 Tax=Otus sunia TaxID=257818 RepID=A0A8C8AGQ6_9STRI